MAKTVLDKTGDYIGKSVDDASQFASSVADAVEDGLGAARRAAKDGSEAVERFVKDTNKRVRRNPIESVLTSLAFGLLVGFLVGRATAGD
jgi:ElaB/YqjD/DUF883 family membrane-anchored ribosome-binding protein